MNVKLVSDNRTLEDKKDDSKWNKLCNKLKLTPIQRITLQNFINDIMDDRVTETEAAVEMSYIIAMNEVLGFGKTRIMRVKDVATENVEKAYSYMSYNGSNNISTYDGCALERLNLWCRQRGFNIINKEKRK